ncbi:MAG: UDP-N-acetylglucosamine 2-epimerase (hydrolyzing) [Nitrospirae bacterium]|nr:UDP-N-acetylglucosamine 2-epimerase (hydrolyzing) [Nitrospirota bacterium]
MAKRKIAVVLGSRANYASIKSVLRELKNKNQVELQIYLGASALLDKYGKIEPILEADGLSVNDRFYMLIEGETPETMAMSTGLGIIKLSGIFQNNRPDVVVSVGDRFETMSTAISAAYLNIHLAHTMGGEVSGTIDESIRHAVTKFAHIHFPANERAAERIRKMGENPAHIFVTGCPRIDVVKEIIDANRAGEGIEEESFWKKYKGVGGFFSLKREKFLLVMQHPVTTEFEANRRHISETLSALQKLQMPVIMLWPNADAGSDEISKEIRTFREKHKTDDWLHLFKNLPMDIFIRLMDLCACMVGNSSSAIREGAIVGVPAVNIGSRQSGRCRGLNIMDVDYNSGEIYGAVKTQLSNGKYPADNLYGDGNAGVEIAKVLSETDLTNIPVQKKIMY